MFRFHAQDDRNQAVRLVRFLPGGPRLEWRSPLGVGLMLVAGITLVGIAAIALVGPDVVGLTIFSVVIAPTMTVILTALANIRTAWRERSQVLRVSMNSRKLCAACAYDLSSHEPEPDGCTVCPECSAAWRLDHGDVGSSIVVVPRDP